MVSNSSHDGPLFVVIGKTRTQIWEGNFGTHVQPFVIYDPLSRPTVTATSGTATTSNYDSRDSSRSSNVGYHLWVSWMKPSLNEHYCDRIYQHVKGFDHIYLVGGGIGRWSGVNNFMDYAERLHPGFSKRVTWQRYLRFTDFPQKTVEKIFTRLTTYAG